MRKVGGGDGRYPATRALALALSGFLACSLFSGLAVGRDDPLEVLWCTDIKAYLWTDLPYVRKEPMIEAIIIPAHNTRTDTETLEVRKVMRQYFPRTYEELTTKYEFIVLKDIDTSLFTPAQLDWMRKAIEEEGLGSLSEDSVFWYPSRWAQSTISDAFPTRTPWRCQRKVWEGRVPSWSPSMRTPHSLPS